MTYAYFKNTVGSQNRQAKLNENKVRHIYRCVKAGVSRASLAALFGVAGPTIRGIMCGNYWRKATADLRKHRV